MGQVLLSNTIDWKTLITINLQKHPELESPPVAQEDLWSRSRSLPLPSSPVLWLFLNVPRWARKFPFGSRAWKWHPEGPTVALSGSSLMAPQTQSSKPETHPKPGQWARSQSGRRPLGSARPSRHSHAAATHRAAWEKGGDPSCSTLLHPPGAPEPSPPFPLPHPGKPGCAQNRIAMHWKARRRNSVWRLYLAEPRSLRLLPRTLPLRCTTYVLIPSCGLKRCARYKAYMRPGRTGVGQGYKLPFIINFIVLRAMHTLSLEVSVITLVYIIDAQRH